MNAIITIECRLLKGKQRVIVQTKISCLTLPSPIACALAVAQGEGLKKSEVKVLSFGEPACRRQGFR
jgi:hypothetical protein